VIVGYAETVRLLAAWCEWRQAFRQFRTDRIETAAFLDERFGRRPGDLRREWKRQLEAERGVRLPRSAVVAVAGRTTASGRGADRVPRPT
jgi:predicted DNA-binding transcriptional regulator YafY